MKKSNTDGQEAVTVVGVFPGYADARRAVEALRAAGYRDDQIGVFGPDDPNSWEENAGIGAAVGGVAGLGLGAALAVGLVSPLGPVVAGGMVVAVIAGASAGAGLGTLVGALVGLGVSEEDARHYATELEAGRVVVTVRTANAALARDVMNRHGAFHRSLADNAIPGHALPATPY
ncbi:general stress protein [Gemmata sp. JC717]|uniref:general stress protein n=1 Tax=Gemmata algarum TaxID=2975278 RepID=UPI0021BA6749|nr:general stress protein [Gemmata algarum]MDY3551964.1 general stress protein [Gemmata algarum]